VLETPFTDKEIERSDPTEDLSKDSGWSWVVPYVEASLDVPTETPIHEASTFILAGIVADVVEIEGPVHREEVARRITSLWGLQRTGSRIVKAISKAVDAALGSGVLRANADFLIHSQRKTIVVRSRDNVVSTNLRKPEMIPPSEIREAALRLVAEHVGLGRDELPFMVARALGFKATSQRMKETVDATLTNMLEENAVIVRDQKLFAS
jgi:hypothetical protein